MKVLKPPPHVIAVGFSVRSLVDACANAGIVSVAVDHFGDADTRAIVDGRWLQLDLDTNGLSEQLRHDLSSVAADIRQAGGDVVVVLAGGMENQSLAVEQLRRIATVLGPTEEQRSKLRDIEFLREIAVESSLNFPQSWATQSHAHTPRNCLWKPYSSAGGLRVARRKDESERADGYWQETIDGEQVGAICIATDERAQLLGFTGSFDSADWPGPTEFIYRGSWGPIRLSDSLNRRVESLADSIRKRTGYRGWLQFDFIRTSEDLHLLECNPRWTAGMEVLEKTSSVQPLVALLRSYDFDVNSRTVSTHYEVGCFAKAIVYADEQLDLNAECIERISHIEGAADLPFSPQTIERGHPIATVCVQLNQDSLRVETEARTQLLNKLKERRHRLLETIAVGS